jgi:tetratricopeptide (TPR) repeat protein
MRKIPIVLVVLAAAAVAVGLALWARARPEWTTDSPEALAEFEAATRDLNRLYHREAAEHLERAAELDPDFLMPKLILLQMRAVDRERMSTLIDELKARDLDRVTPRERLLTETTLASVDRRPERAEQLVADYLERHPEDPWAVSMHCDLLWSRHDWQSAQDCYRRLIEVEPNWVEAQNRLGYIAMAQGKFAEAEEQFEIYRFVAPDQPNPHDSLGELLMIIGRWREARQELEQALAIKPDFCASWGNLAQLSVLESDYDAAEATLEQARKSNGCPPEELEAMACRLKVWRAFDAGDWIATLGAWSAENCTKRNSELTLLAYRAALVLGDQATLATIDARVTEAVATYGERDPTAAALRAHLEGLRLVHSGDPAAAVERFEQADRLLAYWSGGQAYFKLANRQDLHRALEATGRTAEAAQLLAEQRRTNPQLVERWRGLGPAGG